jgi:poly(3-hydroxyalkanoate) synthetase
MAYSWSPSAVFLWPALAAAAASEATAAIASEFTHLVIGNEGAQASAPDWATPNKVVLELPTMRLRDFSTDRHDVPTLICTPFSLHGATIADFAPGHSLVRTLRQAGLRHLFVTEWRSATPQMRFFSIDNYLADLNVAIDELGGEVELVGICQGGWLALIYAARFPGKVRRLVIAGAPIDIRAGQSRLSQLATTTPLPVFQELIRLGDGRVLGHQVLGMWGPKSLPFEEIRRTLDLPDDATEKSHAVLIERFRAWHAWTVDLPGTYYLQVVEQLFQQNQFAAGSFVALGRRINLATLRIPVFLLAARDDELVAPAQVFATEHLIGTHSSQIETATAPCGHLGLFMGARTLRQFWPRIASWLSASAQAA